MGVPFAYVGVFTSGSLPDLCRGALVTRVLLHETVWPAQILWTRHCKAGNLKVRSTIRANENTAAFGSVLTLSLFVVEHFNNRVRKQYPLIDQLSRPLRRPGTAEISLDLGLELAVSSRPRRAAFATLAMHCPSPNPKRVVRPTPQP